MTSMNYDEFLRFHRNIHALIKIFPRLNGISEEQAYRKLSRLERRASRLALRLCNGGISSGKAFETKANRVLDDLDKVLGFSDVDVPVIFNRDPRGYALKIHSDWIAKHKVASAGVATDWGGYGIIVPIA